MQSALQSPLDSSAILAAEHSPAAMYNQRRGGLALHSAIPSKLYEKLLSMVQPDTSVQVEPASIDQAPKRYQETEQGRQLLAVSEAVAELLDEDDIFCASWRNIEFVQNPHPDCQLQQQEEAEEQLTINPIRNFVRDGPPEEHLGHQAFLLASARMTGTTTNSTTKTIFGHIPGAVERFKSKQQLQAEAFEFVQLPDRDDAGSHHRNKLAERYKAITGQTETDALPETQDAVVLCSDLQAVAGKIRLYSGQSCTQSINIACCIMICFKVFSNLCITASRRHIWTMYSTLKLAAHTMLYCIALHCVAALQRCIALLHCNAALHCCIALLVQSWTMLY